MAHNTPTVSAILFFLCFAVYVIYVTVPHVRTVDTDQDWATQYQSTSFASQLSVLNGTKIVLLTSSAYWGMRFHEGRLGFINAGCKVSNCFLTYNHTFVPDYAFDAFLFHIPTQTKVWFLPNRKPEQIFVLFSTEPPGIGDFLKRIKPPVFVIFMFITWRLIHFFEIQLLFLEVVAIINQEPSIGFIRM